MNQNEPFSSRDRTNVFSEVKQTIQRTARETADEVKEQAAALASQRKSGLADQIDEFSSEADKRAESWEERDPNIAWATHQVADRLKRASEYVRERDLAEIKKDAAELARRHPALFFGGLFLAGVVVGNLLKASADKAAPKALGYAPRSKPLYPVSEDVVAPRNEEAPWPEIPSSEAVK